MEKRRDMENLEKLLKENEQIWFKVDDDQKKDFLRWAKLNNCSWGDREIVPEKDCCGNLMGIGKNLVIGYVGGLCFFGATNAPLKINFKDFIKEEM